MIHQALWAALTAGSAGLPFDVYEEQAKPGAPYPYAVYTVIDGNDDLHLRGDAGTRSRLVQIDAYARSRARAEDMIQFLKAQMMNATAFSVTGITVVGGLPEVDDPELRRATREFTIRFAE